MARIRGWLTTIADVERQELAVSVRVAQIYLCGFTLMGFGWGVMFGYGIHA